MLLIVFVVHLCICFMNSGDVVLFNADFAMRSRIERYSMLVLLIAL